MLEYLRQIYDFYGAYGYYPNSQPYGGYDPFSYAYQYAFYSMSYPYACCEPYPYPDPCYDPCSCQEPIPGFFPDPFGGYDYGYMPPQEAFI